MSCTTSFAARDASDDIMAYQAEAFAQSLRQARLQKGWSQRDLSSKAGIPQAFQTASNRAPLSACKRDPSAGCLSRAFNSSSPRPKRRAAD